MLIPVALAAVAWSIGRATGSQAVTIVIAAPASLIVGAWYGIGFRKFMWALAGGFIAVAAGMQGVKETTFQPSSFGASPDRVVTASSSIDWSYRGSGKGAIRFDMGAALVRDGQLRPRFLLICKTPITAGCHLGFKTWDGWGTVADEATTTEWRADVQKRAPAIAAASEGLPFVWMQQEPAEMRADGRRTVFVLLLATMVMFAWPRRPETVAPSPDRI